MPFRSLRLCQRWILTNEQLVMKGLHSSGWNEQFLTSLYGLQRFTESHLENSRRHSLTRSCFFLFRSFPVIGKRRSDASTSIRNCRISKAWSQITTEHRNSPSNWPLPSAGCDTTGPKDSWRTQRLPSQVLESRRHFSLYSSKCQWNRGARLFFSKAGWDHRLVIKRCPLTLWLLTQLSL